MTRVSQIAAFLNVPFADGDNVVHLNGVQFDSAALILNGETRLVCQTPRLAFARVLSRFFPAPEAKVLRGDFCLVKHGAVIGMAGFGFERDESGIPVRIPHYGNVKLGKHVEVGANTVIARGTMHDTVIGDYTKLDDHVFIAHNVHIGDACYIVAGAVVCGSVTIGNRVYVGAGATIKDWVKVGDEAYIGMGAVVLRDVDPFEVVVGNPARHLRWAHDPIAKGEAIK